MSWYEARLDSDDNGTFLVGVPAFPEVSTFGKTSKEALENARNAIEEAIAFRIAESDQIPSPTTDGNRFQYAVQMPLQVVLKAGLYLACKDRGITRAELARRLNWHREQVDRLFRLDHNSRLDQIESAFNAIGVELVNPVPDFHAAA